MKRDWIKAQVSGCQCGASDDASLPPAPNGRLTSKNNQRTVCFEGLEALGNPTTPAMRAPGSKDPNPETGNCDWDKPFIPHAKIRVVRSSALKNYAETVALSDRNGKETTRRLTRPQLDSLLALGLVETLGRRQITIVRPRPGVSVAAINQALRIGRQARLPVAEDNRTVRRADVTGIVWEQTHVAAWSDGRPDGDDCGGRDMIEAFEAK